MGLKESIIVPQMTKLLREQYSILREGTIEEMRLEAFPQNCQWRRRRNVLRQP